MTNDADKRPRIYGRAEGKSGIIEVIIRGGEGETVEDISGYVDDVIERMEESQGKIGDEKEGRRLL